MQIKIEIDVKPEELRRFLGLPDVAGLQEEIVQFVRDRVSAASETFDPTAFVRANVEVLKKNPTLQRIWLGAGAQTDTAAEAAEAAGDLAGMVEEAVEAAERAKGARRRAPAAHRPRKKKTAASRPPSIDSTRG